MKRVPDWIEWRPSVLRVGLAVVLVAAAAPAQSRLRVDGVPVDEHGATSMAEQERRLEALLEGRDPLAPPRGIDPVIWRTFVPADNAMTAARVRLGRKLYFDKRLSRDGTVACATCHDVARGFTDQRPVSEGIGGKLGRRNAPTTLNTALIEPQFLDGRAATIEDQARQPILNPIEMGQPSRAATVAALSKIPEYDGLFRAAYDRGVNYEDIGRAIAAFERTLIFLDSPLDAHLSGKADALSEDARKGLALFNGKARCVTCHPISDSNPLGADHKFHNIGVSARTQDFEKLAREALDALGKDDSERELDRLALSTDLSELGRFMVTRSYSDIGAFRTPQLRNIGLTAPYMHDGSMRTLWDVMDHYNRGGEENPYLDGGIEPLALTDAEIDQLVAFLFALTDDRFAAESRAQLEKQRRQAAERRPFKDEARAFRRLISFGPSVGGMKQEQDR